MSHRYICRKPVEESRLKTPSQDDQARPTKPSHTCRGLPWSTETKTVFSYILKNSQRLRFLPLWWLNSLMKFLSFPYLFYQLMRKLINIGNSNFFVKSHTKSLVKNISNLLFLNNRPRTKFKALMLILIIFANQNTVTWK